MIEQSQTFEFGTNHTNLYIGHVYDLNQQQIGWIGMRPKSKLFSSPQEINTNEFDANLIFHTKESIDTLIQYLEELKELM